MDGSVLIPFTLVWAKLKGHSWWPAKVVCLSPRNLVKVSFFADDDRSACVALKSLKPLRCPEFEKFSQVGRVQRALQEALAAESELTQDFPLVSSRKRVQRAPGSGELLPPPSIKYKTKSFSPEVSSADFPLRCMLIGGQKVGKTSLILRLAHRPLDEGFPVPILLDNPEIQVPSHAGGNVNIILHDTISDDQYLSLQSLLYPQIHLFLLCFSIASRDSFRALKHKWLPLLQSSRPSSFLNILVGTHADRRSPPSFYQPTEVPVSSAMALKDRLQSLAYIECSALTELNVDQLLMKMSSIVP